MTRSDRTNASFVNQARRVALRCAKTARAEDQIRHLMFSVVTPERVNLVSSRRAREAGTAARSRMRTRTAKPEVHVRYTSRVTSPTPFGVQKQNWRVRRLVSSRRGPPFFASGGHTPIETVGALGVAGWVCDGRRSAPYLIPRTRRIPGAIGIARLFGAPTLARPRRWRPKTAAAGEKREVIAPKSTRPNHSRGSSRQRCAQSPDLPGHSRSRACGVPRRTR